MDGSRQFYTGETCPACALGTLCVYHTRVVERGTESYRLQYLWCGACHHTPERNKVQIPLRFAPRRVRGSIPRKLTVRRRR